ncbi:M1 family metallopeptidase [Amycolatopsis panacis]|uniref:Aminopeptidase N n=1 Tax=Amycolatopsis panacis TaxID=2340917 RepID=A0A419HUT7_9PSEU|nr:M1 family metallopeptidase [Amycolatopsis panacis]RJQ80605.1 M1 family peptidase [Amycolatopsis panacis]
MLNSSWIPALVTGSALLLGLGTASAAPSPGSDGIGDPLYPQDGNGGYRVSHYDVKLDYDPAKPDFLVGDTTVDAVATQDLSQFDLDLEGFTVDSVTVDGVPAAVRRAPKHELVITPGQPLARGKRFAVRVRYSGRPGVAWSTASDQGAVHVFGEPHTASGWYPVNDHPSDKATFHVAVTVPDAGWSVLANGAPETPIVRNGKKTFGWTENRPVASYLTGLVIDKFTVRTSKLADGTPVVDAYAPGAESAEPFGRRLPEVMDFLVSKFGPYPFSSVGGIFYPGDSGGGFELQQRPVYPGGIAAKDFTTIVHELAHQWYGNSVSVRSWRDVCLKECFATYTEWLWNEAKEGHDLDAEYRQKVAAAKADPEFWQSPLADPGKELYGGSYTVGPLMLHALRRTIGDAAFFRVLKDWPREHRYGNAAFTDFEQLARRNSGQDLRGFFQAWAYSTTIPSDQYLYPGTLRG